MTQNTTMASRLSDIPPELLYMIASELSPPMLHNLGLVSRGFHQFIKPKPLSRDETYELYKMKSDRSFGYQQVCKTCIRLRSFYHFPTTKTGTNEDDCLDCLRKVRRFHTTVVRWLGMPIIKCRGCFRWVVENGKPHACLEHKGEEVVPAFIGFQSVDAIRELFDLTEKLLPKRYLFQSLMMPGRVQLKPEIARRKLGEVVDHVQRVKLEKTKAKWLKKQQMMRDVAPYPIADMTMVGSVVKSN